MKTNEVTSDLWAYPAEALKAIKAKQIEQGREVYDFGLGDPKIPIWPKIREAIGRSIPEISSYPSIRGTANLKKAHENYLTRRFGEEVLQGTAILPTRGSKEGIFHVALSLVCRSKGRKTIVYPDPGYPVYRSSTLFAGGTPVPYSLTPENDYKLEPWKLEPSIQKDLAAVWVNYPHNPTGACVDASYWQELIHWCQKNGTMLLSDDCYLDIYDPDLERQENKIPTSPIGFSRSGVLSFLSLSKRSGLTGIRAGMVAGDEEFLEQHVNARANFGLANPEFIQAGAAVAWNDDAHVANRRKILFECLEIGFSSLRNIGLLTTRPEATFYLWVPVPRKYPKDDVQFALELAEQGVIVSPAQWLGEASKGFVRFAMSPPEKACEEAFEIFANFSKKYL